MPDPPENATTTATATATALAPAEPAAPAEPEEQVPAAAVDEEEEEAADDDPFAPRPSPRFPPAVRAGVCDFLADIAEELGMAKSAEVLRDQTATMRDVWWVMRKLHECDTKLGHTLGGRLYGNYMKNPTYDFLLPEAAQLVLAETSVKPEGSRPEPHVHAQLPLALRREIRRALARYNKTLEKDAGELPPEWWKAAFCTWWLAAREDRCMHMDRPEMEVEAAKLRDGLPALTDDEQEVVDDAVEAEMRPRGAPKREPKPKRARLLDGEAEDGDDDLDVPPARAPARAPAPPARAPKSPAPKPPRHPRLPTAIADTATATGSPARKKQRKAKAPAHAPEPEASPEPADPVREPADPVREPADPVREPTLAPEAAPPEAAPEPDADDEEATTPRHAITKSLAEMGQLATPTLDFGALEAMADDPSNWSFTPVKPGELSPLPDAPAVFLPEPPAAIPTTSADEPADDPAVEAAEEPADEAAKGDADEAAAEPEEPADEPAEELEKPADEAAEEPEKPADEPEGGDDEAAAEPEEPDADEPEGDDDDSRGSDTDSRDSGDDDSQGSGEKKKKRKFAPKKKPGHGRVKPVLKPLSPEEERVYSAKLEPAEAEAKAGPKPKAKAKPKTKAKPKATVGKKRRATPAGPAENHTEADDDQAAADETFEDTPAESAKKRTRRAAVL